MVRLLLLWVLVLWWVWLVVLSLCTPRVPVVLCPWHLLWARLVLWVSRARDPGLAASLARNTSVLTMMYMLANENVSRLETIVSAEVSGPLTTYTYLLNMLDSESVWLACLWLFPSTAA